jgi:hypothetical protein
LEWGLSPECNVSVRSAAGFLYYLQSRTVRGRLINNTNITFSHKETSLLEKGLKYNLQISKKNWIVNLAIEAEIAITCLLVLDCKYYRKHSRTYRNITIMR